MAKVQISAVIITLNEGRNLARALDSLAAVADDVVIVDSGSTDRTLKIAERHNARFLVHPWEGYAGQKNFAASQARFDWVLSLDADEALSPELAAEFEQIKHDGPGDAAGFSMSRLARFRGRWIRHSGWYPDRKLRLYHRRRGRWVGRYVHEHVEVDGVVRQLASDLHHFPCDVRDEQFRSVDRYTTLAARQAHEVGEGWILPKLLFYPSWKFLETYLLRGGILDGTPGLTIATMAGYYTCQKYAKLWQMGRVSKGGQETRER